ncbi:MULTISPECIES: hypothetical protein [unclassified Caballeronia]|uniref:hypothetical protein n=1 Tax=unclassified Caballeronia TaxID=2646786 RepID=UPI001588978C|nr:MULTISPECIES: hypothetical protein [unclassified Caballeronia]QSN63448.1 hypothetical protein JYK05_14520 [Caballeronia sp. M1242]
MASIKHSKLFNAALWICAFVGAGVWAFAWEAIAHHLNSRLVASVLAGDVGEPTAVAVGAATGIIRFSPIVCTVWAFSTRRKADRFSLWRMTVLWASAGLGAVALAVVAVVQLSSAFPGTPQQISPIASPAQSSVPRTDSPPSRTDETATEGPGKSQDDTSPVKAMPDPQQQFVADLTQQEPDLDQIAHDPDWKTYLQWNEGASTIADVLADANRKRDVQTVVNVIESFKLSKNAAAARGVPFLEEKRYEEELMRQAPFLDTRTYQTSFDCKKALSTPEYLVCHDAELASADLLLAQLVQQVRSIVTDQAALTERLRKQWNYRQQRCLDKPCLAAWYAYERDILIKVAETGNVNAR